MGTWNEYSNALPKPMREVGSVGKGRKPMAHKRELRNIMSDYGYERLKKLLADPETPPAEFLKVTDMLLRYGVGTTSTITLDNDEVISQVMEAAAATLLARVPGDDKDKAWDEFLGALSHQFGKGDASTDQSSESVELLGAVNDLASGDLEEPFDS